MRSNVTLTAACTLLLALGCAQEEGEVCQRYPDGNSDCGADLVCCGGSTRVCGETFSGARGVCMPTAMCPVGVEPVCPDGGSFDAGPREDAGPGDDASAEDASADDAGAEDASAEDASAADAGAADAGAADASAAEDASADDAGTLADAGSAAGVDAGPAAEDAGGGGSRDAGRRDSGIGLGIDAGL